MCHELKGIVKNTSLQTSTHNTILITGNSNIENVITWEFIIETGQELDIMVNYDYIKQIKKNKKERLEEEEEEEEE